MLCVQYRPPLDSLCVEFPAGLIDQGESAEEAALRELREETYVDRHVSFLWTVFLSRMDCFNFLLAVDTLDEWSMSVHCWRWSRA